MNRFNDENLYVATRMITDAAARLPDEWDCFDGAAQGDQWKTTRYRGVLPTKEAEEWLGGAAVEFHARRVIWPPDYEQAAERARRRDGTER